MALDFFIYLFYGLAFFTLGVAIFSKDTGFSELGIAGILWLLGLFGVSHGLHEWLELFNLLSDVPPEKYFTLFRLAIVSSSFLFLLFFGLELNLIVLSGNDTARKDRAFAKTVIALVIALLTLYAVYHDYHANGDLRIRLLIALPGGLLSGCGMLLYSKTVHHLSPVGAAHFIKAGAAMIVYAVLAGGMPSNLVVPGLDIPIVLLRGLSAVCIMLFTIRALSIFNLERRKLIDEQLHRFSQSEKLNSMGILAAGIAHEINNPLTNVSLNVEMVRDMVIDNPRAVKKLKAIERNVERASRIARELLHFSREKETSLQSTDIGVVLASVRNLLKNHEKYASVSFQLSPLPAVNGISWKLEEVFINLIINALDACERDDRVTVTTSTSDGQVSVQVKDTGIGIDEENLGKIFDPFFTTKDVGKGTGIGLSICYNIIKQHGGSITLTSKVKNGTTVTVTLPEHQHGK